MYGIVVMAPYWLLLTGVVAFLMRTRRRDMLLLAAAATVAGLAVLAKGIAGVALPGSILLGYVGVQGRWRRLADRSCLIGIGVVLLIVVVVAVPWHHAMYIRHGDPWWNELYASSATAPAPHSRSDWRP
jgi:4-amino-4-deoxy-L-arabinose transferase-like glycosyltransferase